MNYGLAFVLLLYELRMKRILMYFALINYATWMLLVFPYVHPRDLRALLFYACNINVTNQVYCYLFVL